MIDRGSGGKDGEVKERSCIYIDGQHWITPIQPGSKSVEMMLSSFRIVMFWLLVKAGKMVQRSKNIMAYDSLSLKVLY